jgi:hypothetical protein
MIFNRLLKQMQGEYLYLKASCNIYFPSFSIQYTVIHTHLVMGNANSNVSVLSLAYFPSLQVKKAAL